MKIVIPMLGKGSKFIAAGFPEPKPLVKIRGRYMFAWALAAISFWRLERDALFLIRQDHVQKWKLDQKIRKIVGAKAKIQIFDFTPQGAAKTVLLVRDQIDNHQELVIYNADQFFNSDLNQYLSRLDPKIDGVIPFFHATHPKWSFLETDHQDNVLQVAEKEAISNQATVGLYYFKQGQDFIWAADQMIKKKIMINNEFYVCPVYNELIAKGKTIKAFPVKKMWSLGTPEDVEKFEKYYKNGIL